MSLVTRLSGFFLAALAPVLGGFSVALYLLAGLHFQRDLDERLVTALDILSAAAEVDTDDVEWKPTARPLMMTESRAEDPVRWVVSDGRAKVLEACWNNLSSADMAEILNLSPEVGHRHDSFVDRSGRHWRVVVRRIHSGSSAVTLPDRHEHSQISGASFQPAPGALVGDGHASLILAAGAPSEPMEASLRNLALILTSLSLALWILSALVGRRLCNRALLPVTRMARVACAITSLNHDQRLPSPRTGDELDALAKSFNGLLDRLHDEFERQKRFTGDASHQLRTPLTALLGQLEVARRRDRSTTEYRRVLDDVHSEAVKLCHIVDALLFLARAENEAGRPDLQPVELVSWTQNHLAGWANHPRGGDLRDELDLHAPAWARAHLPLLGQLVDNLLDNACKYSTPGTLIEVGLRRDAGALVLSVRDHGVGLIADDLPHIFEPFFRSAEARRRGQAGVGLGLTIVQRIATVLGGTITGEVAAGEGSRFVLRLPETAEPLPASGLAEPVTAMSPSQCL